MVVGDLHGNTHFARDYIYPTAAGLGVHGIVQLGDFGYWEHEPSGVAYLDALAQAGEDHDMTLYWLRGNHDNLSLALRRYGHDRTGEGFIRCRDRIYLIPDGHVWTWAGTRARAFGGAYSTDKAWRLDREATMAAAARASNAERAAAGEVVEQVPDTAGTLWFPEEELDDDAWRELLAADSGPCDIVLSHDKPLSANCGLALKDEPACQHNQRWLQRVMIQHRPALWLHGHLHLAYRDVVRHGDDDAHTEVVGLGCDTVAAGRFHKPWHAWGLLELAAGRAPRWVAGAQA